MAILQYSQDYDEYFPILMEYTWAGTPTPVGQNPPGGSQCCQTEAGITPVFSGYGYWGWTDEIYPYVKSTGVFHCPDDTINCPGCNLSTVSDYSMNYYLDDPRNYMPWNRPETILQAKISSPTEKILLGEIYQGHGANYMVYPQDGGNNGYGYSGFPDEPILPASAGGNRFNLPVVRYRHNNTQNNWLYCDGHVKASSLGYNLIGNNHSNSIYCTAWNMQYVDGGTLPCPNSGS